MTKRWYLIPIIEGPYSRTNPQRPQYLRDLQANWFGQALPFKNRYVCLVNTTDAKHTTLVAQTGVKRLPDYPLQTLIGDLPPAVRNEIQSVLEDLDLPYYEDETLKHCVQRIIVSGLFELPNVSRDTLLKDLPLAVRQKGAAYLDKWGVPYSGDDTILDILVRCRDVLCPIHNWNVGEH